MPEYSDGLILAWQLAAYEAGAASSASIEPGHFFVSLCKMCDLPLEDVLDGSSKGAVERKIAAIEAEVNELKSVFGKIGLDPKRFRRSLRAQLQGEDGERPSDGVMHRSSQSRRLFSRAERMCSDDACRVVGMLHLLRAIGEVEGAPWETIIEKMGVNRADLVGIPVGTGGSSAAHAEGDGLANDPSPRKRRTPFLDEFGRDLTKLAVEGKMSPVIGRREELRRLGRILLQQRRNNAILVGDAGVGKTCIVEGLAQRIVAGECPEQFRSKRIIEISMSALVAGSKYRGDLEERIQGVLSEAGSDPSIVLFIDEMHTLVGAGSAGGGGMDAANILKPALARGDISCIGASTTREYRQYIEKDSALARRFQVVWVDEPTRGEAIEIMQGLRPTLEQHHGLTISDEALEAAVEFSMRYATDLRLPDKAIDLIDEACARARFKSFRDIDARSELTRRDIAEVVSERYRVPLEGLAGDQAGELLRMEEILRRRVKGQDEAISAVVETIRAARAGLNSPNRPLGVFLFLGPTGTGKTELAKALAEFLFGDERRLVRLDMSEYSEKHTVSRLIGAPPGYIGHEEEGQLTSAIRTHPYSVILMDEIEKGHSDIHHLFLQVFDDGRLTDSQGRRASFTESVVIMTSNLGYSSHAPAKRIGVGFSEDEMTHVQSSPEREQAMAAVKAAVSPEFLNRIGKIVFFGPLDPGVVREIIDKILAGVSAQLAPRSIVLDVDTSVYDLLMAEGYDEAFGARAMERAVQRLIAEPLGKLIVEGSVADGTRVTVSADGKNMCFEPR